MFHARVTYDPIVNPAGNNTYLDNHHIAIPRYYNDYIAIPLRAPYDRGVLLAIVPICVAIVPICVAIPTPLVFNHGTNYVSSYACGLTLVAGG